MDKNSSKKESCIIKEGVTTRYFKLERGTCQGDSLSAYLSILVLEAVSGLIKSNQNKNIWTWFYESEKPVTEIWRFLIIFQKFLFWNWINQNDEIDEIDKIEQVLWKG